MPNYSRSVSDFRGFVNEITAGGGADSTEDIMGGLNAVFTNLYWRKDSTKVILYYATYARTYIHAGQLICLK